MYGTTIPYPTFKFLCENYDFLSLIRLIKNRYETTTTEKIFPEGQDPFTDYSGGGAQRIPSPERLQELTTDEEEEDFVLGSKKRKINQTPAKTAKISKRH